MKTIITLLFLTSIITTTQAQQVRDFVLEDINKQTQKFSALKGEKLTVIDFWASWCKPCLKGMPKIEKLFKANKSKGVNFVGINCDGPRSASKAAPLTKTLGITYPMLTDMNNDLMKDLEISALPTLLIVDPSNKIVYRHEGFAKGDDEEIQEVINKLLKQ